LGPLSPSESICSSSRDCGIQHEQDQPSGPTAEGWFNPSGNIYFEKLHEELKDASREDLYRIFWHRPAREKYGENHVSTRPKPGDANGEDWETLSPQQRRRKELQKKHQEVERRRRLIHRRFQRECDERCPQLAFELAREYIEDNPETRGQSSKGAGKYQQLVSAVFMNDLSAYVVQSEHEGRVLAEKQVERQAEQLDELLQTVEKYRRRFGQLPSRPSAVDGDNEYQSSIMRSRKRRRTTYGESTPHHTETKKMHRFPPSPSSSTNEI